MVDEKNWTGSRLGPFLLGTRHPSIGPGMGTLYQAWHVETGAPALVLMPGSSVQWKPAGAWRLQIAFDPHWSAVAMVVEKAPEPVDPTELVNLSVLTHSAITLTEDNPQVRQHLATAPTRAPKPPGWLESGHAKAWLTLVAGICALFLQGLSIWTGFSHEPCAISEAPLPPQASQLSDNAAPQDPAAISYPLPSKPFENQAAAPCRSDLDEVEINGGCWMTLKRRPPCLPTTQGEYKGECYLPVSKDRGDKPKQSIKP